MDFGDGFGIAHRGGTDFVVGHEMQSSSMEPPIVAAPLNSPPHSTIHRRRSIMAKGQQRANKEAKKPKKDTSPPKPVSATAIEPVRTVTTAVIPRGKLKNK
jgi:hypothetical protein